MPKVEISGLAEWRKTQGIRFSDFARKLGISPSYLFLLETGKRGGSQSVLDKLEKATGKTLGELFSKKSFRVPSSSITA